MAHMTWKQWQFMYCKKNDKWNNLLCAGNYNPTFLHCKIAFVNIPLLPSVSHTHNSIVSLVEWKFFSVLWLAEYTEYTSERGVE